MLQNLDFCLIFYAMIKFISLKSCRNFEKLELVNLQFLEQKIELKSAVFNKIFAMWLL